MAERDERATGGALPKDVQEKMRTEAEAPLVWAVAHEAVGDRVAFWERSAYQPGGEVWINGGTRTNDAGEQEPYPPVQIRLTSDANLAVSQSRIKVLQDYAPPAGAPRRDSVESTPPPDQQPRAGTAPAGTAPAPAPPAKS